MLYVNEEFTSSSTAHYFTQHKDVTARFNMLFVQSLNDPTVNGPGCGRGGSNKVEEMLRSNILITILVEVSQQSFEFLTPAIWEIR